MEFFQLLITGISQGCIYGLVALGFVLIYKSSEIINFAQGELMMFGAYFSVTFITIFGLPWWVGLLFSIIIMGFLGYFIDYALIRILIGQPAFATVLLTISLGFIFRSIAGFIWGHEPLIIMTPYSREILKYHDLLVSYENIIIILFTTTISLILFLFFKFTKLGLAIQAASQNQLAAYLMGIPVKKIYSLIWAISSILAAIAGILLAPITMVHNQMGFIAIKSFAAAVIGGFGSLPGAVIGGIIIGVSEQLAGAYLSSSLQESTAYLIMLIFLIFYPDGIFAQIYQKKV